MSTNLNLMTVDPVTPEQIEAGLARGRKERSEAFRSLLSSLFAAITGARVGSTSRSNAPAHANANARVQPC